MKAFVLFLLCFAVCACGGGGGGGSSQNPLTGTFSGGWTSTNGDTGGISFNVDANGEIAGALTNTTQATDATLLGQVNDAGASSIDIRYDGVDPFTATGTLSLNGGNLSGTLTGNGQTYTLSMVKQ